MGQFNPIALGEESLTDVQCANTEKTFNQSLQRQLVSEGVHPWGVEWCGALSLNK